MNFIALAENQLINSADVTSFSVISRNFALDVIPQDAQYQIKYVLHMLVHLLTKFDSDLAIFYLSMTSNIQHFFTTFFSDHLPVSSSLFVSDHKSSNCYYFWTTHPFHKNDLSLESFDVAVFGFVCFRCLHHATACICEPKSYVYIICSFIDKFMSLLFVYQLNYFSTGHKYLLQRKSLSVAIRWGVYHVQIISWSLVITKWVFLTIREI